TCGVSAPVRAQARCGVRRVSIWYLANVSTTHSRCARRPALAASHVLSPVLLVTASVRGTVGDGFDDLTFRDARRARSATVKPCSVGARFARDPHQSV